MPRRRALSLLSLASLSIAALTASRTAEACGAAYPGGPVVCIFPDKRPAEAPLELRLSASYAFTDTTLLFGDDRRAELRRHAVFGGVQLPISESLTAQFGAGGIAAGELVHGAATDTIGPGFASYGGLAWRVYEGTDVLPFIQLTTTLSVTHMLTRTDDRGTRTDGSTSPDARAETPRFNAFDVRLGGIVGKTFADTFTPYVTARVFGGPIFWQFDGEDVVGTDQCKVQLGGGLSLTLFDGGLDLFAEGIPLGEQGVAAGVGTTFF